MPSLAGFDSFGSFMRGMESGQAQQDRQRKIQQEAEDRAYQQSERDYQAKQRAQLDPLRARLLGSQVTDAENRTQWGAEDRPYLFQSLQDRAAGAGIDRKLKEHEYANLPEKERRQREVHDLNVQNTRQAMNVRAAQEGRLAALDQMRMQMAELGLDDARLQRDQRDFAAKIGDPARRFALTGDTKGISAAFREVTGGEGELVRKDDGSYAISSPEGETPIGTRNDVIRVLSTFSQSPEAYLNLQYQIATGAGRAGSAQPANVREIEYIAERMPRLEGESDQDHFMRAAEFVKRTGVRDPEVEFRSLMLKIMEGQRAETGKVDRDAALEEARYIMGQKLSPRQQGGGERRATGRTQDDPIEVSTLSSRPPPGTWVRLPDGNVAQVPN